MTGGIGEYRRLYEDFLTGTTGRLLRKHQPIVRDVAYSLLICPGSVSWGLFYKPLGHLAHDMGRSLKQLEDSLKVLGSLDYAHYDPASEWIWVKNMAAIQHRPLPLKPGDNRIKAARRWYSKCPRNPFLGLFFDLYDEGLCLSNSAVFAGTEVGRRASADLHGAAVMRLTKDEPPEEGLFGVPVAPPKPLNAEEQALVDFDEWWTHYPEHKQTAKAEARTEWLKKRPKHADQASRLDVLERQKETRDWTKEDGQFVPLPAKYIKREQWNDTVRLGQRPELSKVNEANLRTMNEIARDGKL